MGSSRLGPYRHALPRVAERCDLLAAGTVLHRPGHRLHCHEARRPRPERKDREIALHGRETGRIVRLPHGEFIEVHAPLDEYKRYKLVGFESPSPLPAEPNANGVVDKKEKRRAKLSQWFFEDRVAPGNAPLSSRRPMATTEPTRQSSQATPRRRSATNPTAVNTRKARSTRTGPFLHSQEFQQATRGHFAPIPAGRFLVVVATLNENWELHRPCHL